MVASTRQEFQLLITDDNAAFRQVLREVLEGRPFLVLHEAESGEEAVDVVQRQRIDIVLLDMHMHVMTGIETMRELKRMDNTRPCILITSDTSDEVKRDARQLLIEMHFDHRAFRAGGGKEMRSELREHTA